ncbi:Cysteine oxygenase/2-aminoethanethiol dioxygenase [Dillenia turbinata]|uniref:cysteine dioxygenase n=1 Tax=Dillenia turbinata TaxID=194707 RepID=A0AAN8VX02_9MAGN
MPVEAARLVNPKKSEDMGEGSRVIRKKKCKRTMTVVAPPPPQPSRPKVPTLLQKLYLACRAVFKGPETIPCPADVQLLCRILDDMKPEDVGLSSKTQSLISENVIEGKPRVTSSTIYHCENFSLCMFFLPATAVIPLHNHPGMTVFNKLLLGKMHIKAYDWVDPSGLDGSTTASMRLARLKVDSIFTAPCDTSVLYPTWGGNIHAVRAETPCAFLDVLGPPYSKKDGRDGSYYKDLPYTAFSNGTKEVVEDEVANYGWLEEIEMPEESEMDYIPYLGPQIMEASR